MFRSRPSKQVIWIRCFPDSVVRGHETFPDSVVRGHETFSVYVVVLVFSLVFSDGKWSHCVCDSTIITPDIACIYKQGTLRKNITAFN